MNELDIADTLPSSPEQPEGSQLPFSPEQSAAPTRALGVPLEVEVDEDPVEVEPELDAAPLAPPEPLNTSSPPTPPWLPALALHDAAITDKLKRMSAHRTVRIAEDLLQVEREESAS